MRIPKRKTADNTTWSRYSSVCLKKSSYALAVRGLYINIARTENRVAGDQHDIPRELTPRLVSTVNLSEHSLRSVPCYGSTDFAARDHAEPKPARWTDHDERHEPPTNEPPARFVRSVEIPFVANALERIDPSRSPSDGHTANRCRPLRRRRAKTARPALELIRIRNPWVFFRLRLFG